MAPFKQKCVLFGLNEIITVNTSVISRNMIVFLLMLIDLISTLLKFERKVTMTTHLYRFHYITLHTLHTSNNTNKTDQQEGYKIYADIQNR